ncbi:MAG: hypothetical protein WC383_02485 [Gammaproteobacteria bacterium]
MGLQLLLLLFFFSVVFLGLPDLLLAITAALSAWTFRKAFVSWRELLIAESLMHAARQKQCAACGESVHARARICCFCGWRFEPDIDSG